MLENKIVLLFEMKAKMENFCYNYSFNYPQKLILKSGKQNFVLVDSRRSNRNQTLLFKYFIAIDTNQYCADF